MLLVTGGAACSLGLRIGCHRVGWVGAVVAAFFCAEEGRGCEGSFVVMAEEAGGAGGSEGMKAQEGGGEAEGHGARWY